LGGELRNTETSRQTAGATLTRRSFLGLAASGLAVGAAVSLGSSARSAGASPGDGIAIDHVRREMLGCELWNCQALFELNGPETLSVIAQIGYEYVEIGIGGIGYGSISEGDPSSGSLGMSAKQFRKALDDNGLWCNGINGTVPYPYNDKSWKSFVEDNLVVGTIGLGNNSGYPTTYSDCMRYVDAVNKAHDVARRMGFKGYLYSHMEANYWNFVTDRHNLRAVDIVLKHTTPDVFNLELDTGNSYAGLGSVGAVIAQVRKSPGRWPLFHMKDTIPAVYSPDGTNLTGATGVTVAFGAGVWGAPDPSDPNNRPHAGFQDLLTAIRETQNWNDVLLIPESNGSQATCADYSLLAYRGLNGLKFPYRRSRGRR
jgi:sugar phosphate isomerase/epimerase